MSAQLAERDIAPSPEPPYELVPYESEAEWHAIRETGIGASEAAAALGFSRWKSPDRLFAEKLGIVAPDDLSDNDAVQAGIALEPRVLAHFTRETGLGVELVQHREGARMFGSVMRLRSHPWVFANPDALTVGDDAVVECKTAGLFNVNAIRDDEWGEPWTDQVPENYGWQAHQLLAVTGRARCFIPVFFGGRPPAIYVVERDDETIALMLPRLTAFWHDNVLAGEPPAILTMDDARRRFPRAVRRLADATDELLAARTEYWSLQRRIDALEAAQAALKTQAMAFMGESDALVDARQRNVATWGNARELDRARARETYPEQFTASLKEPDVDSAAFKAAIGTKAYESLMIPGAGRRFAFTKEKA